ncbi:hypothetical protein TNCV_4994561 [Trichonephila clavipes]|nr:hypothetical protein TNCV_4994561 [Trichonephila clavipes]
MDADHLHQCTGLEKYLTDDIVSWYWTGHRLVVKKSSMKVGTATAGSDVVQSGRPIFNDFFQHLWPYIRNNTANIVFQMVKSFWLIRIDQ